MKELNKNRFEKPELTIIKFTNDDIITTSGDFGDPNRNERDLFPNELI